jgi:NAD(P)-dependent dehydrogenase (short-subunit alcohol dehydrogenase family)
MYRAQANDGVAWVTGASSGIGKGTALELARRGYIVVATARRATALEAVTQSAQGMGGRIVPLAGDVTDRGAMAATIDRIEKAIGPVVLAFLNAGTYMPDQAGEFGGDGCRQTFDINVMGTMNCLGPVLTAMLARRKGQIAINGSVAGYGGLPRAAAYGASKAALICYAESMYFSLKPLGITIQMVNPGFVKTPLTDKNTFPMPFLVGLEEAARHICDGFERAGFEITFPKRLSFLLKTLNLLPYPAYFWALAKATAAR